MAVLADTSSAFAARRLSSTMVLTGILAPTATVTTTGCAILSRQGRKVIPGYPPIVEFAHQGQHVAAFDMVVLTLHTEFEGVIIGHYRRIAEHFDTWIMLCPGADFSAFRERQPRGDAGLTTD